MKKQRKLFIEWLFKHSQRIYTSLYKSHNPWKVTKEELLQYPKASIGRHLGEFLHKNGFELIPKVERHDCYHIVCGYNTAVEDEIALQCLCFGNGKRSPYMYGAIILGVSILPDYLKYYYRSYRIGLKANPFHHYDFSKLLKVSLDDFRSVIFSRATKLKLKTA